MSSGYQVEFEKRAQKALKKIEKHQSLLIMGWIQKNLVICTDSRQHGKELAANQSGEWRYGISDYRLVANINGETVTILMLESGHRNDIYIGYMKLLKNEYTEPYSFKVFFWI